MKATIRRGVSTDTGTFGTLAFGRTVRHTLELPWRNNARQRSCIPVGVYRCSLVNSPRFGIVYQVHDVPGRTHVLIHPANLAGDIEKGWETELQGCIAPAVRLGAMKNDLGRMQPAGLVSRTATRELMEWAGGKPFTLEIQ
jgi:hypothetical protein